LTSLLGYDRSISNTSEKESDKSYFEPNILLSFGRFKFEKFDPPSAAADTMEMEMQRPRFQHKQQYGDF
jgi:hypothetical protein